VVWCKEFRSRKSVAMQIDPLVSVTALTILRTKRDGPPAKPAGLLFWLSPQPSAAADYASGAIGAGAS
jgi:hypothetical protein